MEISEKIQIQLTAIRKAIRMSPIDYRKQTKEVQEMIRTVAESAREIDFILDELIDIEVNNRIEKEQ